MHLNEMLKNIKDATEQITNICLKMTKTDCLVMHLPNNFL